MTMPEPLEQKVFVEADGKLAERWCHAHLMDLTVRRAVELRFIHRHHRPDDCLVHLQVAVFVLEAEADGWDTGQDTAGTSD
ncbi:hypothetical protein OIE68_16925 [Nocardia vinacea]|uniref:hypothetical protein n=1 Tax=Nocardia vinacea TaxID=96468 RepID=UPI002E0FDF27|nr:hypothetical protein OIE68_16925 [Nocardia vinacea]